MKLPRSLQNLKVRLEAAVKMPTQATWLGSGVWLVRSTLASPFLLAHQLEVALDEPIRLVPPPEHIAKPHESHKQAGAWRTANYAFVCCDLTGTKALFACEPARPVVAPTDGYTYFILSREAVKIGRSQDPNRRLLGLATAHADHALILLGTIPGGANEKHLHQRFARLRLCGEWFRITTDLAHFIRHNAHLTEPGRAYLDFHYPA